MAGHSILKQFAFDLDLKRTEPIKPFEVVDGDTGNVLVIGLYDNGTALDLTGKKVAAVFATSRGTAVQDVDDGSVAVSGGTVTIALSPGSFAPGMVECEIEIGSAALNTVGHAYDKLVTVPKFNFACRSAIRDRTQDQ